MSECTLPAFSLAASNDFSNPDPDFAISDTTSGQCPSPGQCPVHKLDRQAIREHDLDMAKVGAGRYTYELVQDWPKLPEG